MSTLFLLFGHCAASSLEYRCRLLDHGELIGAMVLVDVEDEVEVVAVMMATAAEDIGPIRL